MPLIKSGSKKAFQKNVETEMKANPGKENRAQNLAIAYNVQRKNKVKKMYQGGQAGEDMIKGKSIMHKEDPSVQEEMRPMPDQKFDDKESVKLNDHMRHLGERDDAKSEPRADADNEDQMMDELMMSEGGLAEDDLRKQQMVTVDDQQDMADEMMLDGHPRSHDPDQDAKSEHEASADDEAHLGEDMLRMAKGGAVSIKPIIGLMAKKEGLMKRGSIADAIMAKKMSDGGEADLQENGDEMLNREDQLSYDAARKKTYYDDSQLEAQPEDSNEHGDELADADEHDMVGQIMKRARLKR